VSPLAHYRDLLTAWPQLGVACCITYAEPLDVTRFLARIGAAVTPVGELSFAEAVERELPTGPVQLALVDVVPGWVVAVEPYGFQGARAEVLRALSADGRAVAVSWNVNGQCRLGYAREGQLLARLDPLEPEPAAGPGAGDPGRRRGRDPAALTPYLAGLSFAEDEQAAALSVAERITGVRLDDGWVRARHRAVRISPLPADVIPEGYHDHPAIADPELRAIINDPRPETLPRLASLAADLVARHIGLGAEPLVAETLAALREGRSPRPGLGGDLAALTDEYARRRDGAVARGEDPLPLFYRWHGLRALAGALDPDPGKAAWTVCWLAGNAVGGNFDDQLRLAVLSRLVDRASGAR
jgi:Family of unknown function (DUF6461)